MELVRRVRFPAAIAAGVVYVAVLPWLGWHWFQPVLLMVTAAVLYWLPGLDTFARNFRAGYSQER